LEVTVLGKSPSWQDAGGACSGYLVEEEGVRLLLDCGNGVFAKLRAHREYDAVDAVLISHLHADHFLDLVPYSYALTYGPRRERAAGEPARPVLHAPEGARETFRRVVGAWGSEELVENAFDLQEYEPDDVLHVGPLTIGFQLVPHYVRTHAVGITSSLGGGRFTFGADSAPSDELCAFARDTDLLLMEATLPEPEPSEPRGHLTAGEAGEHARRAGARRLVITHISDELDLEHARAEAARAFGGPVEVAREGATYAVP
jgi:ribonuclease BN (tRNA processing enzyme)